MVANAIVPINTSPALVSNHTPILPPMQAIQLAEALAKLAHKSGMSKAKTEADAFFVIMYGYELGVSPMTALRSIYSVGGAPTCSGEMMLALIRSSGKAAEIRLPNSEDITTSALVYMKRADTGEDYKATFSLDDARKAQLIRTGSNWEKYPKAMLLWRAVSICAKVLFSDVIAGLYTLEEIAPDTLVDETGAPVGDIIEAPAPSTPAGQQPDTKRTTPGNGNGKAWHTSADTVKLVADTLNMSIGEACKVLGIQSPAAFTGDGYPAFIEAVKDKLLAQTASTTQVNGETVDTETGEILDPPPAEAPDEPPAPQVNDNAWGVPLDGENKELRMIRRIAYNGTARGSSRWNGIVDDSLRITLWPEDMRALLKAGYLPTDQDVELIHDWPGKDSDAELSIPVYVEMRKSDWRIKSIEPKEA